MPLIIDGYNLLHVTGISGRGPGLQGSREALLRFLAATIEPTERPRTTIVFDAAGAPPGLPRVVEHDGMTIRYAANYDNADELIEELIAADHAPKTLLVVSSDHRIQRAARRRRAEFVDSDVWFADALRRRQRVRRPSPKAAKPNDKLSGAEIAYWLEEFAGAADDAPAARSGAKSSIKKDGDALGHENPFPPGYGEDLLDSTAP